MPSVIGRTVFMYLFVLVIMRLMGKREIGQLSPFDLVVAIMIADLASMPLEEKDIHLIDGVVPIAILAGAEILLSFISLKSNRARELISGNPTVVIENGRILEQNLKRLRYNTNDLLAQLREKDVSNLADVEYAILETSGRLSVIKKSQKRPVTPEDLQLQTKYEGLSLPVINDGEIHYANLSKLNLSVKWLQDQLRSQGIDKVDDVLLAEIDTGGKLFVAKKGEAAGAGEKDDWAI